MTANFNGALGDGIDVRLNYLGRTGGEKTPAGLTVTLTQPTGGTKNPDITTGLANLASHPFDFIVMPFTDPAHSTPWRIFSTTTPAGGHGRR